MPCAHLAVSALAVAGCATPRWQSRGLRASSGGCCRRLCCRTARRVGLAAVCCDGMLGGLVGSRCGVIQAPESCAGGTGLRRRGPVVVLAVRVVTRPGWSRVIHAAGFPLKGAVAGDGLRLWVFSEQELARGWRGADLYASVSPLHLQPRCGRMAFRAHPPRVDLAGVILEIEPPHAGVLRPPARCGRMLGARAGASGSGVACLWTVVHEPRFV